MKKNLSLVCIFFLGSMSSLYAQDIEKEFSDFEKEQQQEFDEFKNKADAEFESWHNCIYIIIPRNKSLMANSTKQSSAVVKLGSRNPAGSSLEARLPFPST